MPKTAENFVRALRLPFITASALPFIFGSLVVRGNFNTFRFILGLFCAVAAHLSANLINDYADSKSGADWQDKTFYKFFGGSKLIQERVFSEKFFFTSALFFAFLAAVCAAWLSFSLHSFFPFGIFLAITLLSWLYSRKPLQFSYHRLGEAIIFALFGPACVMGGYFLQTGIFPDLKSFLLSLPFGCLTTAILFANEVPDFAQDRHCRKFNWVSVSGPQKAFILYGLLICAGFFTIILNVGMGYLKPRALLSLIFIFPALKAAGILKKYPDDKTRLVASSGLTIAVQTLAGVVLILGLF